MEGKRNSVMNKRHISSVLVLFLQLSNRILDKVCSGERILEVFGMFQFLAGSKLELLAPNYSHRVRF